MLLPRPWCSACRNLDKVLAQGVRYFSSTSESAVKSDRKDAETKSSSGKLSKVMRAYVERSIAYNEFMKKEERLYNTGKRHLANMMGADPETFTQKDIDEAIEYLFPSGIFDKQARPLLKPPAEIFPPKKEAQFDETGRPFHFLFYTGRANFYNILYECVNRMNDLNVAEDALIKSRKTITPTTLELSGSRWLTKVELEAFTVEEITDREYAQFLTTMERLTGHNLALTQKEFVMKYRINLVDVSKTFASVEPTVGEDGREYVTTKECPRKSARADVTVIKPGTGKIDINGEGIDYFKTFQSRSQLLFPLELSGLRDRVDIVAEVRGGGESSQAGAVRFGISWGLRSFVSQDMVESMRIAGLLQRDFRNKERKKPGQEGARRKFTWKKR